LVYVASDARDDDPMNPADVALSMGITGGIPDATMPSGDASVMYRDKIAGVDCDQWQGTARWATPEPRYQIDIDATCAEAGQPATHLVASVFAPER
jgi:hypothetical protein